MRALSGKSGLIAATFLLVLGFLIWGRNLRSSSGTVASLRDVAGMEIEAGEFEVSSESVTVHLLLKNHTRRPAASVVFTVEVLDDQETPLAANPLGNALNILPGASRSLAVPIPLPSTVNPSSVQGARGRVNLVRWQD